MKNSLPKVVKTTASQTEFDRITRQLRNEIYSGARIPRERLLEQAIAETFGVNRMVVRRALSQLSSEGLVVIEPYKGASVAEISLTRIYANYQIISTLEGLAASLAAGRLSGKDLTAMDDTLKKQIKIDPKNVKEWHDLNRKFHRAFKPKDSAKARDLVERHIMGAGE